MCLYASVCLVWHELPLQIFILFSAVDRGSRSSLVFFLAMFLIELFENERCGVPWHLLYSSIIAARSWSDRSLETFSCVIIQEGDPNVARCLDPLFFWSWTQQGDRNITHTAHYSHSLKIWDVPSNVAHVHSCNSRLIRLRWTAKITLYNQYTLLYTFCGKELFCLSIWYFWYGIVYHTSRFACFWYSGSVPH